MPGHSERRKTGVQKPTRHAPAPAAPTLNTIEYTNIAYNALKGCFYAIYFSSYKVSRARVNALKTPFSDA